MMNPNNGWARIQEQRDGTVIWQVGIIGQGIAEGIAPNVKEARALVRQWRRKLREGKVDGAGLHPLQPAPEGD